MRNAKSKFFQDKINDCPKSNDPKKAWTLINTLLRKNNKPNTLSELSVNDNLVSDPKAMAEGLNDYFVNIGPTLAAEYEEESRNVSLPKRLTTISIHSHARSSNSHQFLSITLRQL